MVATRRLIIYVAQILALASIVIATIAGAIGGHEWLSSVAPVLAGAMVIQTDAGDVSVLGALAGFFTSTMLTAVFFVFVDIAYNTRNPFNT